MFAENLQKLQINGLLNLVRSNFFRSVVDCTDELDHVQGQELAVVLEDLIEEQSSHWVPINVPKENIDIVVNFQLVVEVVAHICDQKAIAGSDQLEIGFILRCGAIYSVLDDRKCHAKEVKSLKQSLIFGIRRRVILVNIKQDESFNILSALAGLLLLVLIDAFLVSFRHFLGLAIR